jgi:hypothetical protein
MDQELKQLKGDIAYLRSDVLYLVKLVENLEKKMTQLETSIQVSKTPPKDPFANMQVERL